jgi:hypothetical protein
LHGSEEAEGDGSDDDDDTYDGYDPEAVRRETFETLLKRRIFYADRIEKLEKVLTNLNLLPKDQLYCSDKDLELFKDQLSNEDTLQRVYQGVQNEQEEIWFDIYRSITSN